MEVTKLYGRRVLFIVRRIRFRFIILDNVSVFKVIVSWKRRYGRARGCKIILREKLLYGNLIFLDFYGEVCMSD